eukprot:TRINITY_DN4618_c0_g1_i1.p1 TRINITY_DN4618_c0_g1~~TRINITY_DN4618_c0_g1_i1.p1  ORF type:complete len:199 (-),score=29.36 TRINITY_DN4618_c0_g1_i1:1-597(-)
MAGWTKLLGDVHGAAHTRSSQLTERENQTITEWRGSQDNGNEREGQLLSELAQMQVALAKSDSDASKLRDQLMIIESCSEANLEEHIMEAKSEVSKLRQSIKKLEAGEVLKDGLNAKLEADCEMLHRKIAELQDNEDKLAKELDQFEKLSEEAQKRLAHEKHAAKIRSKETRGSQSKKRQKGDLAWSWSSWYPQRRIS